MAGPYLPQGWEQYSAEQKAELLRLLEQARFKASLRNRPWRKTARPKQLPPDDPVHHLPDEKGYSCGCQGDPDWSTYVWLAGRGAGKTHLASNWLLEQALTHDGTYWGVCAPTYRDIRSVCIEGPSGLLKQAMPGDIPPDGYNRNNQTVRLRNGSVIQGYSAEKADSVRGANLSGAWVDELCAITNEQWFHDGLSPALRVGDARLVITTTPRRTRLIKELLANAQVPEFHIHVTRSSSMENPYFSPRRLAELEARYRGTRLYRQELLGELLDDVDGALFTLDAIIAGRVASAPDLSRVVVAVDPATTSKASSDETGIVVAGEAGGHAYILADLSRRGTPQECMSRAVAAYREYRADCIVVETNSGGDYLIQAIQHIDEGVPVRKVHATRGKFLRAQPVAMLMEQGRIHHAGVWEVLEEQLCAVTADSDRSQVKDDRADAYVYAVTELRGLSALSFLEIYGYDKCQTCSKPVNNAAGECPACGAERIPVKDTPITQWHQAYREDADHEFAAQRSARLLKQIARGDFTGQGLSGRRRKERARLAGVWQRADYEVLSSGGGLKTNHPSPGTRSARPRRASSAMAAWTVSVLTP